MKQLTDVKKWMVMAGTLVAISGVGIGSVSAQAQQPPPAQDNGRGRGAGLALVCSTTNYTDVAAGALGMTSPDLRVALVSGKTLTQIAAGKNVAVQTVSDALTTARKADIDQALKDGLITQAEHGALITNVAPPANPAAAPTAEATAPVTPSADGKNDVPDGHRPGFGRGERGLRIPDHNVVFPDVVAAKAIGISCAEMVKAVQGGQTIAQVATSKNVTAQAVIDALTAAFKDAAAQDVKEGLITQAEADSQTQRITAEVTAFVNNARPTRPFGPGNGFPGRPGDGRHPSQPGSGNGNPSAPSTPAATPAASA